MGVNLSHLSLNKKGDNNIFHALSYFQEPKRCIRRINPNPYSLWEYGLELTQLKVEINNNYVVEIPKIDMIIQR